MSLRGDGCGLNWNSGLKMTKIADNTWSADVTCTTETKLQTKVLISDNHWMIGANHYTDVTKVSSTDIYPWFYNY
jgi:hypothetical protein